MVWGTRSFGRQEIAATFDEVRVVDVLMAHPTVLNTLIEEYAALAALGADHGDEQARRRLEDVVYTLCVATGTRDIDSALAAARHQLPGARPLDDSCSPPDKQGALAHSHS